MFFNNKRVILIFIISLFIFSCGDRNSKKIGEKNSRKILGSWYECNSKIEVVFYHDNTGIFKDKFNEKFDWVFKEDFLYLYPDKSDDFDNNIDKVKLVVEFLNDNQTMSLFETLEGIKYYLVKGGFKDCP